MRRFGALLLVALPATLTLVAVVLAVFFLQEWGVLLVPLIVLSVTLVWLSVIAVIAVWSWATSRLASRRPPVSAHGDGASPHT